MFFLGVPMLIKSTLNATEVMYKSTVVAQVKSLCQGSEMLVEYLQRSVGDSIMHVVFPYLVIQHDIVFNQIFG